MKVSTLRTALRQLPKTLDETYNRILNNIPEEYHNDTRLVLQLLSFSGRPVKLYEVAEFLTFNPETDQYDAMERLGDPMDILDICSSLVMVYEHSEMADEGKVKSEDSGKEVRFAHYSVKEYVVSERITDTASSYFHISAADSHRVISKRCVSYMQHFSGVHHEPGHLPLLEYATKYWFVHANSITEYVEGDSEVNRMIWGLASQTVFNNWLSVCSEEEMSMDNSVPDVLWWSLGNFTEL